MRNLLEIYEIILEHYYKSQSKDNLLCSFTNKLVLFSLITSQERLVFVKDLRKRREEIQGRVYGNWFRSQDKDERLHFLYEVIFELKNKEEKND